jgi:hypothetical protein
MKNHSEEYGKIRKTLPLEGRGGITFDNTQNRRGRNDHEKDSLFSYLFNFNFFPLLLDFCRRAQTDSTS